MRRLSREPRFVFPVVLVPAGVAAVVMSVVVFDVYADIMEAGVVYALLDVVLLTPVFAALFGWPFLLIAIAVMEGGVGHVTASLAYATGLIALFVVPWLVDKSIEGDSSSTAGLIHIWDPVLITLPIGAVLLAGWGIRRWLARS